VRCCCAKCMGKCESCLTVATSAFSPFLLALPDGLSHELVIPRCSQCWPIRSAVWTRVAGAVAAVAYSDYAPIFIDFKKKSLQIINYQKFIF